MNSQRKCGAQGAAVLLQEFLWLGECAARSSCHAYHPGYKMIIEKDIHMIWHSQNGIHMFFFFRVTCCSLSKIFQQQGSAQEGDWVHRWRGDLRWGPQDHYGLGLWPASRQWRHEPKKTAAPPDWCCYVRLCVVLISENLWRWALLVFN